MATFLFPLAFLGLPLVFGPLVWRRTRGRPLERALFIIALPTAGFALMTVCYGVVDGALTDWSGARLAPLVAMWRGQPHGYRLYQESLSGVMNGWIYGPVPAIFMIPAAFWSTPTAALITGATINLLASLVPIIWILHQVARRTSTTTANRRWLFVAMGISLFVLLFPSQLSMQTISFQINADSFALGFAAAACAVLISNRTRALNLLLMSVFCSLAVWSKQTLAPFLVVPLVFIWFTESARMMFRAAVVLAGTGLLISLTLVATFGLREMWFNMVILPGTDPWTSPISFQTEKVTGLDVVGRLLLECSEPLCILFLIFTIMRISNSSRLSLRHMRQLAQNEPWLILILAAIAMTPAAIMGYSIVGGYVNHLALTAYFLDAAAVAALVSIGLRFHDAPHIGALVRCSCAALMTVIAAGTALQPDVLKKMSIRLATPRDNIQQRIYAFALAHPGQVYFPWFPLPMLLAEGRLYHFQWGLIDHWLALIPISSTQFAAHVPASIQYIGYTSNQDSPFLLQFIPPPHPATHIPELPSVTLYSVVPARVALKGSSP